MRRIFFQLPYGNRKTEYNIGKKTTKYHSCAIPFQLSMINFQILGFVDTLCDVLNGQWNQCAMGKLVISVCYISNSTGSEFSLTKDNFEHMWS